MPRNCVVFLLLCELTRSSIYGSKKIDSQKVADRVSRRGKRKTRNFQAYLCGSLYSTYKYIFFQPHAFYNKWLQTLFKDQLDRSKATCSFKYYQ